MSPGSSTESYPAFARIGLKENPGKKPQPGNLPQPGFEPGPPGCAARRADRYFTGNELRDKLAKRAARNKDLEVCYERIPESEWLRVLQEESMSQWEKDWQTTTQGPVTKSYFPSAKDRLRVNIPLNNNLTTFLTGHGKLRAYFHRFHILDSPECPCGKGDQTAEHLIFRCAILDKERKILRLLEEAYGEAAMNKTQVYAWHKRFSGGRDSIKNDVRSGRPTTATNEAIASRVRNVVRDDPRKAIKEIAARSEYPSEVYTMFFTSISTCITCLRRSYPPRVHSRRSYCNERILRTNPPSPPGRSEKETSRKHNITALDHPPYSPDLSPPDYFLFLRLKSHLKGRRFNAEEVIANATRALRRVSQNGSQACFQELYTRWKKCVVAEGNYFEGNAVE
ncbi:hypothetical protein ANN_27283 [Periplaneta americana]|uniref:Uncharacterized protein n=1 Tax=Periplaneta americana TaxID=6978 RepID=A0ABQ8RXU1_PERAM|nr:hypothetical protein ANN_27283 [Periplaneta americana]